MPRLSFTQNTEPFELKVDEEVFWLRNPAPSDLITELAKIADMEGTTEKVNSIGEFLGKAMLPNSRQRFRARCVVPAEEEEETEGPDGVVAGPPPIGFEVLIQILEGVLEVYTEGVRPTEDPDGSPSGSQTTGSSSTTTAPPAEASTHAPADSPGA